MGKNIGYLTAKKTKESDEVFTPVYAVEPLLKYIKQGSKILCPFDEKWSAFVKVLSEAGHTVTYSHIGAGKDFFSYTKEEVKDFNYMISNPPFSCKDKVLEHLYKLGVPFMMLLPLPTLQGKARGKLFTEYGLEVLAFDIRIGYHTETKMEHSVKSNHFASVYFCHNVLPERLIVEQLEYRDTSLTKGETDENKIN